MIGLLGSDEPESESELSELLPLEDDDAVLLASFLAGGLLSLLGEGLLRGERFLRLGDGDRLDLYRSGDLNLSRLITIGDRLLSLSLDRECLSLSLDLLRSLDRRRGNDLLGLLFFADRDLDLLLECLRRLSDSLLLSGVLEWLRRFFSAERDLFFPLGSGDFDLLFFFSGDLDLLLSFFTSIFSLFSSLGPFITAVLVSSVLSLGSDGTPSTDA